MDSYLYKNININLNENYRIQKLVSEENYTNSKPRYSEANLIKELEKKGIGRPSTFSNIINTLFTRKYIEKYNKIEKIRLKIITVEKSKINEKIITKDKKKDKGKLIITELGKNVCEFLSEHFPKIMNYEYTSNINKKLDSIAEGKIVWHKIVRNLYDNFNPIVIKLKKDKKEDSKKINKIIFFLK